MKVLESAWADSSPDAGWKLRSRALANLLRMGHCAPSVMKTLLDELEMGHALRPSHTARGGRRQPIRNPDRL